MLVSDILKKQTYEVLTIGPGRTVLDAIGVLVENKIGSLLVKDDAGRIVGIITERDILIDSAQNSSRLGETLVGKIMTTDLVTGSPCDRVVDLLNLMTQRRIRHLPIMRDDELAGLVSIGDLVKSQLMETQSENDHLKDYIQGAG